MNKLIIKILTISFLITALFIPVVCFAVNCDTGGMKRDDYAYYMGLLGIICGFAFVMGISVMRK